MSRKNCCGREPLLSWLPKYLKQASDKLSQGMNQGANFAMRPLRCGNALSCPPPLGGPLGYAPNPQRKPAHLNAVRSVQPQHSFGSRERR
jgi:hypothetical protein